jgi:hypothetical protein
LKEVNHAGKEENGQEDRKKDDQEEDDEESCSQENQEDVRMRPLRNRDNRHQGRNGRHPVDVLRQGDDAEETEEEVLNQLQLFGSSWI